MLTVNVKISDYFEREMREAIIDIAEEHGRIVDSEKIAEMIKVIMEETLDRYVSSEYVDPYDIESTVFEYFEPNEENDED